MFVTGTCPGMFWKKDFCLLENPGIWFLQVLEVLEKSILMSVGTLLLKSHWMNMNAVVLDADTT